jgi:membrane-bound metal-dependent hydrolase YbcI (DUF457 family)
MMAKGHAISGACAGLLVAPLVPFPAVAPMGGLEVVGLTGIYAGLVAVFALFPDIDHRPSTISRCLGPITWLLCYAFMALSRTAYEATRTHRDKPEGCHRTLTHTNAFALVLGAGVAAVLLGTPASEWAWFVGSGVTVGCLAHIWFIGDACTLSGVPHPLWPFVLVDGKRWGSVGYPRSLRFRAGGKVGEPVATMILFVLFLAIGAATLAVAGHPWWTIVGLVKGLDL